MKPAQRSEPTSKIPDPTMVEERVRIRAYELYVTRGRRDGHDLDDWLQAEADSSVPRKQQSAPSEKQPPPR
jgi:hypothetical protein